MVQAVDVRASDADRERVITELQQHTAAGRLSMDEFSERAAAVYRARALSELAALTADLPHEPSPHGAKSFPQTVWIVLALIVVVAAFLGVAAVARAGSMMGGLGCGW
jgi:uncharacterized membrane protein YoaK (UPF0700 family)